MHAWPAPEVPVLPGEGRTLRVHDTSSGALVATAGGPSAGLYVCGITPYDATHLGHAATYNAFDLVQRVWRDAGRRVVYVQNVTDVDDPLLVRARETGEDWVALAERETALFREDMIALRMLPPDHYVGAVEAIPGIVDLVARLRERGAAYDVDGDIYFSVDADPHFGEVSGYDREEMLRLAAERGGDPQRPGKKNPLDPLLWQAARPGEPAWDSPLGAGRPGWHIECVQIALEHLGMSFDVQGGGSDLAFPHHEMGASHAQVLTGRHPYARAYVHAGMVALDGEKMSKSRGNLVFVSRLRRDGADPAAIRLALLAHHYRSDWEWTSDDLERAQARLARWRAAVSRPDGPSADAVLEQVRDALADDLDAPRALATVDAWAERQSAEGGTDTAAPGLISRMADALLGVAL
ncbi:cysteine--1-D-myo-inosityl 2-amino-2-deoxy-alpha-D-glucopyranoside ligase [Allostreptomyces psammosilenae]|uniref:L-cysteine:1D-myo-inositol 2-amino-2-deoxy-alpha-D-glucopyranoside ligase n=1 Tax=Allostreptomyces psammosilenae TaxID=1892865 RepID=A0A852ZT36_9ACTN|nr:cysteine--1-D-myo-inosityl 2-amino-2-deoxy-alpha-D-glucopyranoside ligase [Allostreptomyces psammosilenae]NYI03964.1 L-cysteine:1D-myo-inositol 2-amino-2-deoxy-alpha-D-glucopyranoside ligase [Allostreptomyces psammosilenae]